MAEGYLGVALYLQLYHFERRLLCGLGCNFFLYIENDSLQTVARGKYCMLVSIILFFVLAYP